MTRKPFLRARQKCEVILGRALRALTLCLPFLASVSFGTPSPAPQDLVAESFEFGIPSFVGNVRGSYKDLKFGDLLFDSGPNPLEEFALGEVRRWVFQAKGGIISIGNSSHQATCIRTSRFNVLTPQQEFFYELRVSALEGSCTEKAEKRLVELVFTMDDFVIKKYRSGATRFFGQSTELMMGPVLLRAPERVDAVLTDGGYFLTGRLSELPFVANLQVELMSRPKEQMSCHKSKFNPERDPYSSLLVQPDATGKWGATVPKLGGGVCMRLVGGAWVSGITAAKLP